jgi:hypothetical protein
MDDQMLFSGLTAYAHVWQEETCIFENFCTLLLHFLKPTLLSGTSSGEVRNTERYQGHLPKPTSFGFLFNIE